MTEATDSLWGALRGHYDTHDFDLRRLFSEDAARAESFSLSSCSLRIDFSKQALDRRAFDLLVQLAEASGVANRRDAKFSGDKINITEDRPVLHSALRRRADEPLVVDGQDVTADVQAVLARMRSFATAIRDGEWRGYNGARISTVINIGIGGSDLGPAMVTKALQPTDSPIDVRFVANIDPAALEDAVAGVDPASVLFIIASKTFTTAETITNAQAARRWFLDQVGEESAIARHFVAVSTNEAAVRAFGIDPANMFEFWDWVGGRYSVGSAIGLSVMVAIGADGFDEFLAGSRRMDEHFLTAPLGMNGPVIAALIGIWNRNIRGHDTWAVVPYSARLSRFSAYLQQLVMESNGKSVRLNGEPVKHETSPVLWGEPGTDAQHSFFQLFHQGTIVVPVDFIGMVNATDPQHQARHDALMANFFAQSQALAFGRTEDETRAEGVDESLVTARSFPGNRPSTTILAPALTPGVLGEMIAFYEHVTFVQGVIWDIASFDQWGVELGKVLAGEISQDLAAGGPSPRWDGSTASLISYYCEQRRQGNESTRGDGEANE